MKKWLMEVFQSTITVQLFVWIWPIWTSFLNAEEWTTLGDLFQSIQQAKEQLLGGVAFSDRVILYFIVSVIAGFVVWGISKVWRTICDKVSEMVDQEQ